MILVLEDQRSRVEALKRVAQGREIIWCESISEFTDAYEHRGKDAKLVILDHDLGEEGTFAGIGGYGSAPVGNGMDAVELMCRSPLRPPVIVWSWNGPRRAEMVQRLEDHGFEAFSAPFGPEMLRDLF